MRRGHRPLGMVLVALVSAGCTSPATRAPSPRAAPSPPSPLVTWDTTPRGSLPLGLADASAGQGTLDIAAGCVRLLLPTGERVLLVLPDTTSWDAASQTITFVDPHPGHARVALRHGDRIEPGGLPEQADMPYASASDPYGDQIEPSSSPQPRESYAAPSDPSCPTDRTFLVNQVRMLTAE